MRHSSSTTYAGFIGLLVEPVVRRVRGRGWLHRYRAAWKIHRLLWRITRSNRAQVDGHDLEVDRLDSLALAKGWYEPDETAWYAAHVKPGDFVLEAGSNIGVFTLQLARLVGPAGRVITYEPDPDLRAILERNIATNAYDNIMVRPHAVADRTAELMFFRATKNQGDNRLFSHGSEGDGASFPVKSVRLDDELESHPGRIDLLKMDIQGAEAAALRGMVRTLAERPPAWILMEYWPHGILGMGDDPRQILDDLVSVGYSISAIDSDDVWDVDAGLVDMTAENKRWVNLVLRHRDGGSTGG